MTLQNIIEKNIIATAVLAVFALLPAAAQHKYWVVFKDKPTAHAACVSQEAVRNRLAQGLPASQTTDWPVNETYVNRLRTTGGQVHTVSKWLNAAAATLDENQLAAVRKLPFVQEVTPIDARIRIAATASPASERNYSTALRQIEAGALAEAGLTGKGVKVGIIDVGFYGVLANPALQRIRTEKLIRDARDYVNPRHTDNFFDMETHSDYHGAEVLQLIGGYNESQQMGFGAALGASFYLARTDHGIRETRTEEDNWIAAVERMDSLGVRLVNTSLGYAKGFSNPAENYKPSEMNGKTSKISRAAQIAADQKGMLLVVSAGNEGDDTSWLIVSTPADAQGVLSVGATKAKSRDRMSYSSIGPSFLPYIKPNVSCFSPNGTSFSAPIITGLAACLMEKNPALTNKQIMRIIERSSHLYPYGNNYIGYGVPDARKALQLVADSTLNLSQVREIPVKGNAFAHQTAEGAERAVVFRKKNQWLVLKQEVAAPVGGKLHISRVADEKRTTVDLGNEVLELVWE